MTGSYSSFISQNIAPYAAKKIGVYNSSGTRVGEIPLGDFKPTYGERLYRFGILSDVHQQSDQTTENTADLQHALDYFNNKESVCMTLICGDISQNGTADEFQMYQTNVNTNSPSTPVYTTVGNHDATTSGLNTTNWETYTGHEQCFEFSKTVGDVTDHFLFLGMNKYSLGSSGTPYNASDITWLENKLESYRNERCFIITHLFFPDYAGNFKEIYPSENWLGGSELTSMTSLLTHYSNAIWFSGHSHWKWHLQEYEDKANVIRPIATSGWTVHIPSCASPIESDGSSTRVSMATESEGAIIDVYDNYIDIRAMDLKNSLYLPIAQYRLDTSIITVPSNTATTYTITNNLTNCSTSNPVILIEENTSYTTTLSADSGYRLGTPTITMGGSTLSSAYDSSTGVITISSVTGNVVVTCSAEEIPSYTVTNTLTNCATNNTAASVLEGSSYTATLTASSDYNLGTITVTMGGTDISSTAVSGATITIDSVTGDIVITCECATIPAGYTRITADMFVERSGYSTYFPTVTQVDERTITVEFTLGSSKAYVMNSDWTSAPALYVSSVTYSLDITDSDKQGLGFYKSDGYYSIETCDGSSLVWDSTNGYQFNSSGSKYTGDYPITVTMVDLAYKVN